MFEKLKARRDAKEAQKERNKMDKKREDKCLPLAKYILELIVEADLSLGEKTDQEYLETYNPIVRKILAKFLEVDLKLSDVVYIQKLIKEMVSNVDNLLIGSINNSMRIGEKAVWGVERDDRTFSLLDKVLKEWADKSEKEKAVEK